MPHLILEYSNNIDKNLDLKCLFVALHKLLEEKLPTDISNCKSRYIPRELFFIGNGEDKNAFAHLTIKILAGRSDEIKNELGNNMLKIMSDFFHLKKDAELHLSVELVDLNKDYYKLVVDS